MVKPLDLIKKLDNGAPKREKFPKPTSRHQKREGKRNQIKILEATQHSK
jgi:hypothetical protein